MPAYRDRTGGDAMPIQLNNATYTYNAGTAAPVCALRDVSLTVDNGDILGIMGKTGCGKSTLIQMIAGLMKPDSGSIIIDGEDINGQSYDRLRLRSRLGLVFQYPENQLFETTAYKDVAFGLKYSGLSAEEKDANIRWALKLMGFDPDAVSGRSPLELSGGEKRRLAIAGVLAVRPTYLILDEPFAGLDPLRRNDFIDLLKRLNKDRMTIIIVSHNADALAECADRIALMHDGGITASGGIREVWANAQDIERCGTDVSGAKRVADLLAAKGVLPDTDIVRYEELIERVTEAVEGRKS